MQSSRNRPHAHCARDEAPAGSPRPQRRGRRSKRSYGEFKDGWEFPGGKLEPGETAEQAAVRELREELGVTIGSLEHLCTVEYDYDTFHLSMECFTCEIVAGTIEERVHENMAWLDVAHLWDVDWLPADVEVVRQLEERLAG